MQELLRVSRAIDAATTRIGRGVAWLVVAAIVISAGNAIIRKLLDTSSNAWLELQWWLFAAVFLLAAPWTLSSNDHIRVDILNTRFSRRTRNAIEVIGHVFFLLPMAAVLTWLSWAFFLRSAPRLTAVRDVFGQIGTMPLGDWLGRVVGLGEQSLNAGGLPQWPIKLLIPLAFALLFIQGLSELMKRVAIIRGDMAEPPPSGGFHAAATEHAKIPEPEPTAGTRATAND